MMRAVPDCAVLYPCEAVSTERLVAEMAQHKGLAYMRTSRPKTPVTYGPDEKFPIGGSKVLRQSGQDVATVVGVGVTVFEALKAYDQLFAEGTRFASSTRIRSSRSTPPPSIAAAQATGGRSSRSRIITRPAAWATRSAKRSRQPASPCVGSRCARFRAAVSPTSCSNAMASPPSTSSKRSSPLL